MVTAIVGLLAGVALINPTAAVIATAVIAGVLLIKYTTYLEIAAGWLGACTRWGLRVAASTGGALAAMAVCWAAAIAAVFLAPVVAVWTLGTLVWVTPIALAVLAYRAWTDTSMPRS